MEEFDFIGLGLIVGGIVCLLLGLNFSETSCESSDAEICRSVH
jgi:hypothetical protein